MRILAFIALLLPLNASAALVDFDDLYSQYNTEDPAWYANPLNGDEYLDKGLKIYSGYLSGTESNLYMFAAPGAKLEFFGDLPNFISMNVTSAYGDAVYLSFFGESSFLSTITTSSQQFPVENGSPAIPNESISFTAATGIKSVSITSYWNMRIRAQIDNLNFSQTTVPEPSALIVMCMGLLGLLFRRTRGG